MCDPDMLNQLQAASEGLLFPSESDYPFQAFVWDIGSVDPESLLLHFGHPPTTPVEAISLEQLFRRVTQPQDWHNAAEQAAVQQFQALASRLHHLFHQIQVYRVGTIAIDVYIVGQTPTGQMAGLSTRVIET